MGLCVHAKSCSFTYLSQYEEIFNSQDTDFNQATSIKKNGKLFKKILSHWIAVNGDRSKKMFLIDSGRMAADMIVTYFLTMHWQKQLIICITIL